MFSKAEEIADGFKNLLKSKLGLSSEQDEKIFKARRKVCNACEFRSVTDRCKKCGCPLETKTRSLKKTNKCPEGLW